MRGVLVGDVLPVAAVEVKAFGGEALYLEEAAVPGLAQDAVGLEDRILGDEEVEIAGGTKAKVAEDALGEGDAFEDFDRDACGGEFLDEAAHFGEAAQGAIGVGCRELAELVDEGLLAGGEGKTGQAGAEIVGDEGDQAVMLHEFEEAVEADRGGDSRLGEEGPDLLAVLAGLRPARGGQQEVDLGSV